jgi:hypothetical protein
MSFTVLESINWPGEGLTATARKITGDDRFGFDESSGTAWVLDGATDLGPFRIFEREESDAAWMAEAVNRELITNAPSGDVSLYFSKVLASVRTRAAKETRIDIKTAPRSVWPVASGMWMWNEGDTTHFARLGDCVALVKPAGAQVEVLTNHQQSELESRTSRELNAMSPEDRIKGLQDSPAPLFAAGRPRKREDIRSDTAGTTMRKGCPEAILDIANPVADSGFLDGDGSPRLAEAAVVA